MHWLEKLILILTKSVSRFARNTVDTITTVRQLKEKNVEVYFEKENIYTLDSKGKLLITIMSSLAQEESRSIGENVTWGQRKSMADGKVTLPYKHFLGYEKGSDGLPKIVEREAKVVRMIYKLFLEGKTASGIAKHLTDMKISSPTGRNAWHSSTVLSIFGNKKYKGDALLQKYYRVDFLTKKRKINTGEIAQYYIENSHPAIVSAEVFDLVQNEMKKRKDDGRVRSGAKFFSSKLLCGDCGSFLGPKVWHSTDKYRRTVWQCNSKFSNKSKCKTPHIYEENIKNIFINVSNEIIKNKAEILGNCHELISILENMNSLETEKIKLTSQSENIVKDIQSLVKENAKRPLNQDEYSAKYQAFALEYEKTNLLIEKIENEKNSHRIS